MSKCDGIRYIYNFCHIFAFLFFTVFFSPSSFHVYYSLSKWDGITYMYIFCRIFVRCSSLLFCCYWYVSMCAVLPRKIHCAITFTPTMTLSRTHTGALNNYNTVIPGNQFSCHVYVMFAMYNHSCLRKVAELVFLLTPSVHTRAAGNERALYCEKHVCLYTGRPGLHMRIKIFLMMKPLVTPSTCYLWWSLWYFRCPYLW